MNQILDLRDLDTGCHSTRLAEWGVRVAVELHFVPLALEGATEVARIVEPGHHRTGEPAVTES